VTRARLGQLRRIAQFGRRRAPDAPPPAPDAVDPAPEAAPAVPPAPPRLSPARLAELRAEASYARDKLALYRRRTLMGKGDPRRLAELERAEAGARDRLRRGSP
jgi:hypothetical protein